MLFAFTMTLLATSAQAQERRRAGTVRLEVRPGQLGPLDLRFTQDGFGGEFSIVNDGKEPLVVSRIAVRGDESRAGASLSFRLVDGAVPATIAPGTFRKVRVQWAPERGARLRQLFAHVVVTTSDERSGDVAVGVRAQVPGWLGPLEGHVLSLLIGAPLVGLLFMFLGTALGVRHPKLPRRIALTSLAVQSGLAVFVGASFRPDVSRADGNDGLQFVEHGVWLRSLGAELFFGVDGTCAAALVVTSLIGLLSLFPSPAYRGPNGGTGYHAAYLTLSSAVAGALTAMDGLLFAIFTAVAVMVSTLLIGGWGLSGRRAAATKLALLGTVAVACLFVAVVSLSRHADPTFLVDGTKTSVTFSLPELSRVALGAKGAMLFGAPLVKALFVLVLIASLVLLGAFPLHAWVGPAVTEVNAATAALISASLPAIGACALLRIGCAVLPEGMRWASGVVVALGAVTAALGALGALGQTDLRRLAAAGMIAQVGFLLLGAGSLTSQGLSAAIVIGATRPLACCLFFALAGAIEDRARTADLARLHGIGAHVPGWTVALAIAAFAHAGVMGVGGAWGPMLALLGALPNYPPLALLGALALIVGAVAHFLAVSRIVFGKLGDEWERSALLEPFGGRFPDLTAREWRSVAPVAALLLLLGVWPAPLFSSTAGTVRDLTNAVSPPSADPIAFVER